MIGSINEVNQEETSRRPGEHLKKTVLRLKEPFEDFITKVVLKTPDSVVKLPKVLCRQSNRGADLNPRIDLLLKLFHGAKKDHILNTGPAALRKHAQKYCKLLSSDSPRMHTIEDVHVEGVNLRVYRPHGLGEGQPALVFYHGGGGVVGDFDTHDLPCRMLAHFGHTNVLSVSYRLAPEHPFPNGVEDAISAYGWIQKNAKALRISKERIAVGGDSFGGNLAINVCLAALSGCFEMPKACLLIYPWVDLKGNYPSKKKFGKGYLVTKKQLDWFAKAYLAGSDAQNFRASPMFANSLKGFPPTILATAGHDPLLDEGKLFAEKLEAVNALYKYINFPGLVHTFIHMTPYVEEAKKAVKQVSFELERLLSEGERV